MVRSLLVCGLAATLAILPAQAQDSTASAAGALAPMPAAKFDRAAAAHLLRRAGFGGSPKEIDALHAMGLEGAIKFLVDYESVPNPLPAFVPFQTSNRPDVERGASEDDRRKARQVVRQRDFAQMFLIRGWWVTRMIKTKRPLEERMTLFWHNHFCSGHRDVRNSYHMFIQNTVLRRHATGDFRAFCKAISRDPAMLEYLDNRVNRKQHPNENFARELMELFTLGVGNYTEKDIKECARAFTGWTFAGNRFVNRLIWHDRGEKTVLGKTANFDGDGVIDHLLTQPCASRYIAGKLFRAFVGRAASEAEREALAATLREHDWQLKPALRQLLSSQVFFASEGQMIKSPIDLLAGLMRNLEIDTSSAAMAAQTAGRLGQNLFEPPNVKGWAGGRDWITTSLLFERYNAAQMFVATPRELEMASRALKRRVQRFQRTIKGAAGADPESLQDGVYANEVPSFKAIDVEALIGDADTAEAIVDRVCARMLAGKPTADTREQLLRYATPIPLLPKGPGRVAKLHALLKLIVSTPEFQVQ